MNNQEERPAEMLEKKSNIFQKGNLLVSANDMSEFSVFSYVADMDTKQKQVALISFSDYGKVPVGKNDGLRLISLKNLTKNDYYRLASPKEKELFDKNVDKKWLRPSDEVWARVLINKVKDDAQNEHIQTDFPDR